MGTKKVFLKKVTRNYFFSLMKYISVIVLVVFIADFLGHFYRRTQQFHYFDTSVKFIFPKIRMQLFPDQLLSFHQLYSPAVSKIGDQVDNFRNTRLVMTGSNVNLNELLCEKSCRSLYLNTTFHDWYTWRIDRVARWYYELSIADYREGNIGGTTVLLEFARYLAPDWSYFHIELANLLFQNGRTIQGMNVLNECLLFSPAQSYCQLMIDDHMWEKREQVGFLSDRIQEIGR